MPGRRQTISWTNYYCFKDASLGLNELKYDADFMQPIRIKFSYISAYSRAVELILLTLKQSDDLPMTRLTHWGRATHMFVSKLTIIALDNGLSPGRRQAIIWINDGILLIWPLGANFSEILIEIISFSFKKMHLKMSSGKWRPFCLGLNVLMTKLNRLRPDDAYRRQLTWSPIVQVMDMFVICSLSC